MIDLLIGILVLVLFLAVAYIIITKFITEPTIQQVALLIVGLIGLLILISWFWGGGPFPFNRPLVR